MGGLGAGLLGFAQGAVGAADEYIKEETAHERKFSLEDYRLEKERELAEFKSQLEEEVDARKYARGVADDIRKNEQVSAETKYQEGASTERTRITSENREGAGSGKRPTEAALTRTWTSGAAAINSAIGTEALQEANIDVAGDLVMPSDPEEYLSVLEKIGTPEATAYIDLIHDYLDNIDTWSRADVQDWKEDMRLIGKKKKTGDLADPLGLRS